VQLRKPAWLKLMLHVCKYPTVTVGGFLLGNTAEDVQDAVPVFHGVPTPSFLEYARAVVRDRHPGTL
jgi:hypothetical protein